MIIFNDRQLPNWCRVVNIVRNVKPPRNVNYRNIPNAHGARFIKAKDTSQFIRIQIRIYESNKEVFFNRVEELGEFLHTEHPEKLSISDKPNRFINAITVDEFEIFETTQFGGVWVTFFCPDPYWYSTTLSTSEALINNQGSAPTNNWTANIAFTQPTTNYSISLGNKTISIIWNFQTGDVLEIDARTRKITINGNVQMASFDFMNSEWFDIPVGISNINTSALTHITFRMRWF